ncbi:MAG: tRNA lysidine(34) synthetase TilS, partial [Halieaceae bacterium]|nr:tRNA lysidine(34) synthetase TilS [Halieaceae bacterium]
MRGSSPTAISLSEAGAASAVARALEQHAAALAGARRLLVGFSGGLDSSVLLHALARRDLPRLTALHANHGLHGDAARWAAHCRSFCDELGVSMRCEALRVQRSRQGLEAAARQARYAWFASEMERGDLLLLAHHRDDQVETLLLRLLRGAGPDGLAGMPVSRAVGPGNLLRPLLDLPRDTLSAYAHQCAIRWIDDPSNAEDRFDRNYLRHRVVPLLTARWPGAAAAMARAARLLHEEAQARDALSPGFCFSVVGDPGFHLDALPEDPALAALSLRAWLRRCGLERPGARRLGEFLRQCRSGRGAELEMDGWALRRFRAGVYACPRLPRAKVDVLPVMAGERIEIDSVGVVSVEAPAPAALSRGALELRFRRGGERLQVAPQQHRDLKHVFQDWGLPPWWRDRAPLLFEAGPGGGQLVAVASRAVGERGRALGLSVDWAPPILRLPEIAAEADANTKLEKGAEKGA